MLRPSKKQHGKGIALWLTGLAALAAGVLVAMQLRQPPPPPVLSHSTTRLDAPRALQPFELTDQSGTAFTLDRLRNNWSFLFFGYTHCPDVCPTTMATLNSVSRRLGELPGKLPEAQFVFVSIDPERDTPEQLAKFVPYFNPEFIGVTGSLPAVDAFTKQLSIMYLKVDPERPGGYLMDHSASVLLIDPEGRFHALFSAPLDPENIARDFQQLALYYEATQ